MLSAKYLFTTLLLAVCSLTLKPVPLHSTDTAEVIIRISINPSSFVHPSWLDIYKRKRTVKIVYTIQDCIKFKALRANNADSKALNMYFKLIEQGKLSDSLGVAKRNQISGKIDSLYKKYTVYTKDSVVLKTKTDTAYIRLVEKIAQTGQAELENDNLNKTRFMLDGTGYNFVIKSGLENITVWVRGPSRESNPLLYKLLEETRRIYESQRPKSTLPKMKF